MFRNHKELVDFWKVRNLFEELTSLDNDVDGSSCKSDIFFLISSIQSLSTKVFRISTKPSQIPAEFKKSLSLHI